MSLTIIPRTLFWVFSLLIAMASVRFFVLPPEVANEALAYHALARPIAFYTHVGLASVALGLTPFQFWRGLRMRRPAMHRWMGRGYVISVVLSGVGGLVLAISTEAGNIAAWGFGTLAVVWVVVTVRSVLLAMKGQIDDHRRWMIRSAALTLAGVTLRIYLPIVFIAGLPFDEYYAAIAWGCWVPNLLVAEIWLRRHRATGIAPPGDET
ncbi:putative membrane protein DUF2306 [Yoonia maritima]|uniref:Putative membrane protein DUF2306 n=1 Tax=Yoonia maritima TaxID=1435347 RepID=A0A2T0W0F6_9RHOB|nr:DUF2306 domain-containing protein [Yoonia maritima]PRY78098.1 putative membrane protein DUF2306 [Yoonia maritima]